MQASHGWIISAAILSAATVPAYAGQSPAAWSQSGEATWYGPRHEGHRTTSGERFDPKKLTAAHSSLPIGSWVRVTVEGTGATVVVRVNDREPPHGVRCIDLSRAAAARLGFVSTGVADVTLARVSGPDAAIEVADAPDDAQTVDQPHPRRLSSRHGRRHTHHVRQ